MGLKSSHSDHQFFRVISRSIERIVPMSNANLQEILDKSANPLQHLRNVPAGTYVYPVVASEFSNWLNEGQPRRDSDVLCDQTHHMDILDRQAPDGLKLTPDTASHS